MRVPQPQAGMDARTYSARLKGALAEANKRINAYDGFYRLVREEFSRAE